ncbi:MAG: di-heme oxidoredictase family protein [Marinoscillum sp.]
MADSTIMGLGTFAQFARWIILLNADGRARSIEEAILLHGGEADNSKNQFVSLSEDDKETLIKFLKSL